MNLRKNESGQTFVLTTFAMVALVGMCAFVLDAGSWFRTDRRLQATADAATLAGAQELPKDPVAAKSTALTYADKNGGDVASGEVLVTSTFGPNDTISVTARKEQDGVFSKVLGIEKAKISASAKARVDTPAGVRYVAPMEIGRA